jgi:hypothetical protein
MNANTVPSSLPSDQRGQLIDLNEVRTRLKEKANPTVADVLEALDFERRHVDQLTVRILDLERDQITNNKHFNANVAEVAKPIVAQATKVSSRKTARLLAVFGLILLVVCLLGYRSFQSVYSRVGEVQDSLALKADKAVVEQLTVQLATKANKSDLKVIEAKADRSVVERLVQEIKGADGVHDQRLNDLATDIMSKANKGDVDKLAARLRSTRSKVRSLEQRMKELAPPPMVVVPSAALPKTM